MKKNKRRINRRVKRSFTLIEILVVATIIGLLTLIGLIGFSQISKQSRDTKRKEDVLGIKNALEIYKTTVGSYPGSLNDLVANNLLKTVPTDPKTNIAYAYNPLPAGCTSNCSEYTIDASLESPAGTYQANPYGATLIPLAGSTPTSAPTPTEGVITAYVSPAATVALTLAPTVPTATPTSTTPTPTSSLIACSTAADCPNPSNCTSVICYDTHIRSCSPTFCSSRICQYSGCP